MRSSDLARGRSRLRAPQRLILPRMVAEICRDFSGDSLEPLSHASVAVARDSFAEVLKQMNAQDMKLIGCSAVDDKFVVIRHLHDEACFRLRSSSRPFGDPFRTLSRSTSSKVQNNVIEVHTAAKKCACVMELQPLARKNASCLAHALFLCVRSVLTNMQIQDNATRVIHVVVGDAIPTNWAASRLLWAAVKSEQEKQRLMCDYSLLVLRCCSHQCNLTVKTAITGSTGTSLRKQSGSADKSPLVLTVVRWCKFLLPTYIEEFSKNLLEIMEDRVTFLDTNSPKFLLDEAWFAQQSALQLQALYGREA